MRQTNTFALVWQNRHPSLWSQHISQNLRLTLSHRSFTQTTKKLEHHDALDPLNADLPKPRKRKSDRKPYPTPMKLLIQRAKEEREARKAQPCRMLEHPPDNGLLVPDLVDVAQNVYLAWKLLRFGISRLVEAIPIQRCRCLLYDFYILSMIYLHHV